MTTLSNRRSIENPAAKPDGFDFSPWKDLPPLSPVAAQSPRSAPSLGVGLLERSASFLLLVALSPLLFVIALLVKLSSPEGPVFYRQERVGLDRRRRNRTDAEQSPDVEERRTTPGAGRPFRIFKFRTMVLNAEQQSGPVWASEHDPRTIRIGGILRRSRLDELPQLINVLRGEMRLVGPRPERPYFVTQLASAIPEYCKRLTVCPGITGLAQVEREYDATVDDVKTKVKYDLYYAKNWSRMLDFKILLKTLDVVLRGRGAR